MPLTINIESVRQGPRALHSRHRQGPRSSPTARPTRKSCRRDGPAGEGAAERAAGVRQAAPAAARHADRDDPRRRLGAVGGGRAARAFGPGRTSRHAGDAIPDDVPVLGFLDDAIMIELCARDLRHEIEAYDDFCEYRQREADRRGLKPETVGRADWLDRRREELQERMHRRRSRDSGRLRLRHRLRQQQRLRPGQPLHRQRLAPGSVQVPLSGQGAEPPNGRSRGPFVRLRGSFLIASHRT